MDGQICIGSKPGKDKILDSEFCSIFAPLMPV